MDNQLRKELPPLPARMRRLRVDKRGYPVPWFVAWVDGEPDFRVIRPRGLVDAVKRRICWVCGQPMGRYLSFVLGPMCTITRTTSEPPNHHECAVFAAKACPFLARPYMKRSVGELPDAVSPAAGLHLDRNPGAMAVWTCREFHPFIPFAGHEGILFKVKEPTEVLWFAEGREATRAEVQKSIDGGYPFLLRMAETDGLQAVADLQKMVSAAEKFYPNQDPVQELQA